MYFTTNLGRKNSYHRVIKPFPVYHLTGHQPSNTWVGRSNVLDPVYDLRPVEVGGELHNLHGGLFYVSPARRVSEVVLKLDPKHVFERRYSPDQHDWPLDSLQPLGESERMQDVVYRG